MNKPYIKCLAVACLGGVIVAAIMILSGYGDPEQIEPGLTISDMAIAPAEGQIDQARKETITEVFEAVGTVRPRTETNVDAQVTGRVEEVLVTAGQSVTAGQDLVILDSRGFEARLQQAEQGYKSALARVEQTKQAVASAKAEYDRASSEFNRFNRLFKSGTISSSQMEQALAAYRQAQAGVNRAEDAKAEAEAVVKQAEQQVEESRIALNYTRITALDDAQVVQRMVEPGDLAVPGKPLLILQTNKALRLEALVREGLIERIRPGDTMAVSVDALNKKLDGVVEEVIPSADPKSRTFLVKVALPRTTGLYPGMFGRLMVPLDNTAVVLAPRQAVRRVGQLEMVRVETDGGWREQFVRTGRLFDGDVEILSGLSGGEKVALWAIN
jgi:HlyD family secretion protein